MNDAAFIEAIVAAPDDDAPRLIYADWLDETGRGARAEFIRVQIELDGLIVPRRTSSAMADLRLERLLAREAEESPRRRELYERGQRLLKEHARSWLPTGGTPDQYGWRRGFVERLELREQTGRNAPEHRFPHYPLVEWAAIGVPFAERGRPLPAMPNLRALLVRTATSLGRERTESHFFANLPGCPRLDSLRVNQGHTHEIGLGVWPPGLSLKELDVRPGRLTSADCECLAAMPNLEALAFGALAPGAADFSLASLPRLRRLAIPEELSPRVELNRFLAGRSLDVLRITSPEAPRPALRQVHEQVVRSLFGIPPPRVLHLMGYSVGTAVLDELQRRLKLEALWLDDQRIA